MQSSPVSWEERELAHVLPKIPNSLCAFCHEVIGTGLRHSAEDIADRRPTTRTVSRHTTQRRRRKRCFPPFARASPDIRTSGSETSSVSLFKTTAKLAKDVRKSGKNLPSSSSSTSSLSLYTSESSDEELDKDDRPSNDSQSSQYVFPHDPPPDTVGLPSDYLSRYTSLQDWLARRKSLRNAMGTNGDFTRWLQNKKRRTPLEERVLALSKLNDCKDQDNNIQMTGIRPVKYGSAKSGHLRAFSGVPSHATEHTQSVDISHTQQYVTAAVRRYDLLDGQASSHSILQLSDYSVSHKLPTGELESVIDTRTKSEASDTVKPSENQSLLQKISKSTDHLVSGESRSSELVSVLDDYLTQRRIRLLDLFRCVDESRSGRCSRQDFCYVLKQANVPLTQPQVEHLADSLAVDDHPDCVDYSRLVIDMNRHSEMRLFRKRRADPAVDQQSRSTVDVSNFSSLLVKAGGSDGDHAVPAACPEKTGNENAFCEDQKRSYCWRVMNLFRDNALFGGVTGRKSPSTRSDVTQLKSTMDDDEGLARRLEEIRLQDRIEYEATRNAVRRHRLPVRGRALRRGLLTAADRPRSSIDVRRLPREHMLAAHNDSRQRETRMRIHSDSDDSLDREMEEDERRCATDAGDASVTASASGLRVKSASSYRQLHGGSFTRLSRYDQQSRQSAVSGTSGSDEIRNEEDEEEEEEEKEEEDEEDEEDEEKEEVEKLVDGGAGDRRSTRTRLDLARRRMLWEEEEEAARRNAIYWTGRSDHVRIYHAEGDRGGHPIFERVGQTWYNHDLRYLVNRSEGDIDRYGCRSSFQQQQQSGWAWQRTVEYRVGTLSAVYRCVPTNDSADQLPSDGEQMNAHCVVTRLKA